MELVCSVDLGTTRTKAALVDSSGKVVRALFASADDLVGEGRIELDAGQRFEETCRLLRGLLGADAIRAGDVAALCLTNQRATVVPADERGQAVGPGISWQDARGGEAMSRFADGFGAGRFMEITGLPPSFLWTLSKVLWHREARPAAGLQASRWLLLPDYVLHRLGAEQLVTDASNASLTGMLDLDRRDWSDDLLSAAGLSRDMLPRIVSPGTMVGRLNAAAAAATGLSAGTPLVAGGGDQQCAALGLGVVDPGQAAMSLGTAAVLFAPADRKAADLSNGCFSTAHVVPDGIAREAIVSSFGSSIDWAVHALGLAGPAELDALAEGSPVGSRGAVFYPYLAGAGSLGFDATAHGAFLGIGLWTRRADLCRAVLEGTAMEARRLLEALDPVGGVNEIVLSGGAVESAVAVRILCDVMGRDLAIQTGGEPALLGAAMLAWIGAGRFRGVSDALSACAARAKRRLSPSSAAGGSEEPYRAWRRRAILLRRESADSKAT